MSRCVLKRLDLSGECKTLVGLFSCSRKKASSSSGFVNAARVLRDDTFGIFHHWRSFTIRPAPSELWKSDREGQESTEMSIEIEQKPVFRERGSMRVEREKSASKGLLRPTWSGLTFPASGRVVFNGSPARSLPRLLAVVVGAITH